MSSTSTIKSSLSTNQAIISYKKRPFGLECPGTNSSNFIDENLYLELGFPNQTICYKEQKINGDKKKVVGSLVATIHLIKNEKLDKPIKFQAKIVRNLGVDAISNAKLCKKCGMTISNPTKKTSETTPSINNEKPECDCVEMVCSCYDIMLSGSSQSSSSSTYQDDISERLRFPLYSNIKSEICYNTYYGTKIENEEIFNEYDTSYNNYEDCDFFYDHYKDKNEIKMNQNSSSCKLFTFLSLFITNPFLH